MKSCWAGLLVLWALSSQAQDIVTTLAGRPLMTGASNGPSSSALFNDPAALVADTAGNLFIADSQNHVIRKIDRNGVVTTFAGQPGKPGPNNGSRAQAQFDTPSGIALAAHGNFYVSDTGNHTIRRITPDGAVTTIAGMAGQSGAIDGVGTAARFNSPLGIAASGDETIFVADTGNHLVRAIAPAGTVTTLAGRAEIWGSQDGMGDSARLSGPVGLALDARGDLFVSDSNNHVIRKITRDGVVSTWAGQAGVDGFTDGDRLQAKFSKPAELAFDQHGNLFVADSFNHVIRKISQDGQVSTVTGVAGADGSADGSNGQARLFNPYGLAICPDGSLVVADAYNQLIRMVVVPFELGIHFSASSMSISWPSLIGRRYQAQYRGQSSFGPWRDLGEPVAAAHLNTTLSDNTQESPGQRIYRVMILP